MQNVVEAPFPNRTNIFMPQANELRDTLLLIGYDSIMHVGLEIVFGNLYTLENDFLQRISEGYFLFCQILQSLSQEFIIGNVPGKRWGLEIISSFIRITWDRRI